MPFAMAGMAGIDTFMNVVAFQSNGCDLDGEGYGNLLIQKRNFYSVVGVFLRQQ